ncbi:ribonuclease P protein component [Planctomycetaceae bacterium AH-315-I19]|nr:ribonuclease P protein component [Planctomycetaceae bacterium AH-315-I19]
MTGAPRLLFRKRHRLSKNLDYQAVFDASVRKSRGPMTVYTLPNALGHARLGLSVSRKVGNAVRRGRLKRLVREAFRQLQHELPGSYDLVVVLRAHPPRALGAYRDDLESCVREAHRVWARRAERDSGDG